MEKRRPNPLELVVATQVVIMTATLMALNEKQRRAIRERDEHRCQFPAPHDCNEKEGLEVHHILGQRYLRRLKVDPDYPENTISVCKNAHRRVIHPDMEEARRRYGMDKDAYKKAFTARNDKLNKRQVYWNDQEDRPMQVVATRNTQKAEERGWRFPWSRRKRGDDE
jgi:hypothetical protein